MLLAATAIAHGIAQGSRALTGRGSRHLPVRRPEGPRGYLKCGLAALFLGCAVIVAIDWLGAVTSNHVNTFNGHWWGASEGSPWADAAGQGITSLSRSLAIRINGDELTAEYTVTALPSSMIVDTVESDTDGDAGNDLVDNVLGQVSVGEFHYGLTGHQLAPTTLVFHAPQLQIAENQQKRLIATIDVTSAPLRLYEHQQQITILPPAAGPSRPTTIQLRAPGAQVTKPDDIDVRSIAKGAGNLTVTTFPGSASFMVSEAGAPPTWFDGLRAAGGLTLPIVGGFLIRLPAIFVFALFLWAFYRACRAFPGNQLARLGLRAIQTIVAALVAVAVLNLAYRLCLKLEGPDNLSSLLAGPVGLLVGGAAVVWPAACWRAGSPDSADRDSGRDAPGPSRRRFRWWRAAVPVLVHLAVVVVFLIRLSLLGVSPLSSAPVLASTAVAAVVVPMLARVLLGPGSLLTWGASAALLAAVLAAACSWPLLTVSAVSPGYDVRSDYVNLWGKWTYVSVAVIVAAGLSVMCGRIAWAVIKRYRQAVLRRRPRSRTAPVLTVSVVTAIALAAIVPDAVSESGIAGSHAIGLVPTNLFGLFNAATQLLDWLPLALAIVVTMQLPSTTAPRTAARDMALPIAVMLLYWFSTWLYIPVDLIVGAFLVRRLMMPRELAEAKPRPGSPQTWANDAAKDWRRAGFVSAQQQALAASGTDALRDSALNGKDREFHRRLDHLTNAQDDLAARLDRYQRTARSAKIGAFSHFGAAPDLTSAAVGAVIGAVLGIIPAVITVLTTQPPQSPGSSYPVLGFFGGTAWNLLCYTGLGWFVGYYLPLIRGDSGAGKALWVFISRRGRRPAEQPDLGRRTWLDGRLGRRPRAACLPDGANSHSLRPAYLAARRPAPDGLGPCA